VRRGYQGVRSAIDGALAHEGNMRLFFSYLTVSPYLKWESLLDTDLLAVNCLLVDTSLDMSRTWKNAMSRRCLSSHFVRQPRFAPSHYINVG